MLIFIVGKLLKKRQNNCKMMVIKTMLSLTESVLPSALIREVLTLNSGREN